MEYQILMILNNLLWPLKAYLTYTFRIRPSIFTSILHFLYTSQSLKSPHSLGHRSSFNLIVKCQCRTMSNVNRITLLSNSCFLSAPSTLMLSFVLPISWPESICSLISLLIWLDLLQCGAPWCSEWCQRRPFHGASNPLRITSFYESRINGDSGFDSSWLCGSHSTTVRRIFSADRRAVSMWGAEKLFHLHSFENRRHSIY